MTNFFDLAPFRATGSSMTPLLRENDYVYLQRVKSSPEINDIVLVKSNNNFYIHRIIYKKGSKYITRGDNNIYSDEKINLKQIVGKVIKIRRSNEVFRPEDIYLLQSTLYLNEIKKITAELEKNKISYVILKGLPLHLNYEGRHSKRLYFDCDILVDKNRLIEIGLLFIRLGYKPLDSRLSNKIDRSKTSYQEVSYRKIQSGFPVTFDIHYEAVFMMTQIPHLEALYPKILLDQFTTLLLENSRKIKNNSDHFLILKPGLLIIYLALHYFHHNFQGVFRLELLHKIITKSIKNDKKNRILQDVSQKINKYNLENFVYPTIILLIKHFETNLPKSFIDSIKPTKTFGIEKIKKINIFDNQSRIVDGVNRFMNIYYLSPESPIKKLKVFFNPHVIFYVLFTLKKLLFYFLKVPSKNH